MAGVTIDIPGIGKVEATGAASEATLKELIKTIQEGAGGGFKKGGKPNDAKKDENKGGGGGGGGGAGMGNIAGKALGGLAKSAGFVTGAFVQIGDSSTRLVQQFANVGDSMSSAASVFSGIPLLGNIFGAVAGAAEKTLASYQSATASGATFGNSMANFSAAASAAGMTMDQFGAIIAKNGQALMMLGGTTEEGAKRFANISKELRTSQVGAQLAGLGYSTAQINEGLGNYYKIIGSTGGLQNKSNKELAAGAGAYLKEMDALAKVTGRNRQELENEAEARAKDAQWIAMTTGMDEKQRLMMESFVSSFPKDQQAAVKDMLTTGNITSEAAVKFNAMMGGTAQEVMKMGQAIHSGRKLTQAEIDKTKDASIIEARQKEQSAEFKTLGQYSSDFGSTVVGINQLARQELSGRKKAMTEQEKADQSAAAQMTQFKQQLAAFSNSFQTALVNSGVLGSLMSLFTLVADVVMKWVVPAFNLVAAVVPKIVFGLEMLLAPVIEAISNMMGGSFKNTLEMIDGVLNSTFAVADGVMRGLILALEGAWDAVLSLIEPFQLLAEEIFGTGDAAGGFADVLIEVGSVVGEAFRILGAAIGWVTGIVTDAVRWFKELVGKSEWLSGALKDAAAAFKKYFSVEGIKALMGDLVDGFMQMIDDIRVMLPNAMGGISKEEKEQRDKAREESKKTRDQELEDHNKAREEKIDLQKKAAREDRRAFESKKSHVEGLEKANKKEEEARAKTAELNLDDSIEMLKGFAVQQNSAFIKNPESTPVASAETTKAAIVKDAETKAAAEQKAKEESKAKGGEKMEGGGGSAPTAPTQESPASLLASLNTKMDQLIKINKGSFDVHEKQLNVQRSFSNDLYESAIV